jgi:hypothetical protein
MLLLELWGFHSHVPRKVSYFKIMKEKYFMYTNKWTYNCRITSYSHTWSLLHVLANVHHPVTEEEVISLTKSLKVRPTSGDYDIPETLVKLCIHLIKGTLANIYNLSLNSGFSQMYGRQLKWNLYTKREINMTCGTIGRYQ